LDKFDTLAAALTQKFGDADTKSADAIAAERAMTEAKFDSLVAAIDAKLDALADTVTDGDAQTLADANTYSTEADDALQDYLVSLLARHAAPGDGSVLAPIKQAFDDIFAANTGTNVKDSGGSSTGKKG